MIPDDKPDTYNQEKYILEGKTEFERVLIRECLEHGMSMEEIRLWMLEI